VRGQVSFEGEEEGSFEGVSVWVSALSALSGVQGEEVEADMSAEGAFEAQLSLPQGALMLIVEARRGDEVAQAYRQLILDDFVRPMSGALSWGGAPYRALGVDVPRLLPWLWGIPEGEREAALDELWSELRGVNVRYVRVFVGWTREAWATLSGPQSFAPGAELVDLLTHSAARGGLKLVFVLTDPQRALVGYEDYLRWGGVGAPTLADERAVYQTGRVKEALLSALSLWPARFNEQTGLFYREDPTILGWSLMNAPEWASLSASQRAAASAYLTEAVSLLRQGAPDQLVWTGELGFDVNPTPYGMYGSALEAYGLGGLLRGVFGGAWVSHLSAVNTNINSVGLDVEAFGAVNSAEWRPFGVAWLRGHALAAASSGRPLSLTYARLTRAGVSATTQEQTLMAWSAEAQSQGYPTFTLSELALEGDGGAVEGEGSEARWFLGEPATTQLLEALGERWGGP
jgi:hypothetical protein